MSDTRSEKEWIPSANSALEWYTRPPAIFTTERIRLATAPAPEVNISRLAYLPPPQPPSKPKLNTRRTHPSLSNTPWWLPGVEGKP
jgi:hypothetical protein